MGNSPCTWWPKNQRGGMGGHSWRGREVTWTDVKWGGGRSVQEILIKQINSGARQTAHLPYNNKTFSDFNKTLMPREPLHSLI
uniref:Uncharacterized protein n=1 Tax=Pyxicephalus adspersus TaxID=30357 RepID=A0AAV3A3C3_PYXAD|nr:TPA: hypothetical protein GDO54_016319 [Pyxicephalus adspersus]